MLNLEIGTSESTVTAHVLILQLCKLLPTAPTIAPIEELALEINARVIQLILEIIAKQEMLH